MLETLSKSCTAFKDTRLLAAGPLIEVALAMKNFLESDGPTAPLLAFDDATGRVIDFDLRGTKSELIARLLEQNNNVPAEVPISRPAVEAQSDIEAGGRGRPKLGVVAREVTLLPRHWEWLATQSGGASAALRKLVEAARKSGGAEQEARKSQEVAYRFMSAIGGDLPGFEEATRALFADDRARFEEQIKDWPIDIKDYAVKLAFGGCL